MTNVLRSKKEIILSLIKTYDNNEFVNFSDVREIDNLIPQEEVVEKLIECYDRRIKLDFLLVNEIVEILNK